MDKVEFTCKLCNAKHISTEKSDIGVFLLPQTITTSQDKDKKWYFHCVSCSPNLTGVHLPNG